MRFRARGLTNTEARKPCAQVAYTIIDGTMVRAEANIPYLAISSKSDRAH